MLIVALALAGCASSAGGAGAQAPPPPPPAGDPPSLAGGVYTTAQAAAGAEVFTAVCAECHDTIEFRGSDFWFNWEGSNLGRLMRVMVETMPEDDPGSLPREQYLAVVAYVLELNQFPVGSAPLPDDADYLSALVFERLAPAHRPGALR